MLPDLLENLPPFEQDSLQIQNVLQVITNELARVEQARQNLIANYFPVSANSLLELFEAELGLPVNSPLLTLTSRQQAVLTIMQALKQSGTGEEWESNVSKLVGNNWTYEEHDPADPASPPAYTILVKIPFISPAGAPLGLALQSQHTVGNIVPNGGFEHDTVGSAAAGWDVTVGALTYPATGSSMAVSSTFAHSGSQSLAITGTGSVVKQGAEVLSVAAVASGAQYTVGMWMRGAAGGETVQIGMGGTGIGGTSVFANGTTITLTTTWTRYTYTYTAPAAVTNLLLFVWNPNASAQTWYVDDAVMITGATVATTYVDGDSAGYVWSGTTGNSHTYVTSPLSGTYYYAVTGTTAYGETTPSAVVSAVITPGELVSLSWIALTSSALTGYNVYRGRSPTTLQLLASATTTAYLDNGTVVPGVIPPPVVDLSGSPQASVADKLLRETTPAHISIVTGFSAGFLIGISEIGISAL